MPRRAPDPKGPLDLGHQRNVGFISPTHSAKVALRVLPPVTSGMGVRERGFVTTGDTVWVASSQWVPEPGPPRGGGGDVVMAAA